MTVAFLQPSASTTTGFDVAAQYQMLPSGGMRTLAIWAPGEAEDLLIFPADPSKVDISMVTPLRGKAARRGAGFSLEKDGAAAFFLAGRDPGPTTLRVETERGLPRGFLLISVKPLRIVSYVLYILRDAVRVRETDLPPAVLEVTKNVDAAAELLFNQANVKLVSAAGGAFAPLVPEDLGPTLTIDDPVVLGKIFAAAQALKPPNAHLHIFRTWDIRTFANPAVIGFAPPGLCFVENFAPGPAATCLYAHEICHALGQALHSDNNLDVMFPEIRPDNRQYSMRDIEAINPTFTPEILAPRLRAA